MMEALRVVLADDHPLVMAAVRGRLESEPDIEVVGEASSGAQVLPLVAHTSPTLVLLDLRFPDMDGLTILEQLRERFPEVKVAVLSAVPDSVEIGRAFDRGACAYILKNIDPNDFAAAVRQAVSGTFYCVGGNGVVEVEEREEATGLSGREVEVLQGVARGLSNRAIAQELWLSDQTVKFHLHNIYRKLGVSNRTEAAKYAFEHGMTEVFA